MCRSCVSSLCELCCWFVTREKDYSEAVFWYSEAIETVRNEPDEGVALHELLASQAQLHREGGPGLAKNSTRAG